jgi:hypothetical protein
MKYFILAWTLFLLNPDGSLGLQLKTYPHKDACVIESYRVSFATGKETRCEQRHSLWGR